MAEGQDGYDFSDPFDAKRWAMHHDRTCAIRWTSTDLKLGIITKVGGGLMMASLALLGWSLKANYDNLDAQHQATQTTVAAVHQAASDSSSETVRKLGVTPPPS